MLKLLAKKYIFNDQKSNSFSKNNQMSRIRDINLNFGPQHPSAHGVLRLMLNLNNEVIENCDSHIGLLHRGTEKLMENKIFIQSLPYFDRLDYVSTLLQEHAYCLAIDKLLNKKNYSSPLTITRTVYDEFTRILNHLLAVSCHALDVGSMSPIFWCFEEREKIMEFYERISGARMHTAFYRPVLKSKVLNNDLIPDMVNFVNNHHVTINEINNVLLNNKIWKLRLKNTNVLDYKIANNWGLTGVLSRSSGLKRDLRLNKFSTYNNYYFLNFFSLISLNGDSYDRFLLRIGEINESLAIINQLLIKNAYIFEKNILNAIEFSNDEQTHMENMINYFKFWSEGFLIKTNLIYQPIESGKGEFGISLFTDSSNKPFRCKIKSPSFFHLNLLNDLIKKQFLSDLVTAIGTIDIVFGEIDR